MIHRRRGAAVVALVIGALAVAGCDDGAKKVYVEMATAAQMGDIDGFLGGFAEDSRKLVEAQISISEAYGMEDQNPYTLLVFDEIAEVIEAEKGEVVGKKYECPKPCTILKVMGAKGRRKVKILMLKVKDEWKIDSKALDEYWKLERKSW